MQMEIKVWFYKRMNNKQPRVFLSYLCPPLDGTKDNLNGLIFQFCSNKCSKLLKIIALFGSQCKLISAL